MKKTISPFENRDLHTALRFPVLSWSSVSAWGYDKEEWYQKYALGIRTKPNGVMQGGIDVGERITVDPSFLPFIDRPEIFEQEFFATLGKIDLTGHLDGWSPNLPGIDEYKTTCNDKRWTQAKVDEWGQITFYCLLVWLNIGIRPEKLRLRLFSIPMVEGGDFKVTQRGTPKVFHTKRSMTEVLKFAAELKKIHKEMLHYVATHK